MVLCYKYMLTALTVVMVCLIKLILLGTVKIRTYLYHWVGGERNYVCDICIKSYAIENFSMPFTKNFR